MVLLFCAATQNERTGRAAFSRFQTFQNVDLLSHFKDSLKLCARLRGMLD